MQRLIEPATKLQVYVPESLRRDIEVAAAEAGQTLSTFVSRALNFAVRKIDTTGSRDEGFLP